MSGVTDALLEVWNERRRATLRADTHARAPLAATRRFVAGIRHSVGGLEAMLETARERLRTTAVINAQVMPPSSIAGLIASYCERLALCLARDVLRQIAFLPSTWMLAAASSPTANMKRRAAAGTD